MSTDLIVIKRYSSRTEAEMDRGLLESVEFQATVASDDAGGAGANFIIVWRADEPVTPPVIEAVMIGVLGNQSFSFKTEGKVLAEKRP